MKNKKKVIIAIAVISVALIVYFLGMWNSVTLERLQESRTYLELLVKQRYVFSVSLYLIIFVLSVFLGIPITVILTIAAGALFGVLWGTVYAIMGATGGAVLSFLLFRYLLGSWVQKKYATQLAVFNQNIDHYGHHYLLTLQILPFTPTLLINTLSGLTKISLRTFIWTTSLGILPGSLLYTFAGRQLAYIHSVQDIASTGVILALILLAFLALLPTFFRMKRGA